MRRPVAILFVAIPGVVNQPLGAARGLRRAVQPAPPFAPLGAAWAYTVESVRQTLGKCTTSTDYLGRKLLVFNSFRPNFP
jgi:hypothetical protein